MTHEEMKIWDKASDGRYAALLLHLEETLAVMRIQCKKGLISKEALKGAIQMARVQVKLEAGSKYSKPGDWKMVLKVAVLMSRGQYANEVYDREYYK